MTLAVARVLIILSILGCMLTIICFIGFGTVDHEEYGIISVIAGVLVRELQTIIEFYFKDTKYLKEPKKPNEPVK